MPRNKLFAASLFAAIFSREPASFDGIEVAIFDDTCGNHIEALIEL